MRGEDKPLIVKTVQNFLGLGYGVDATRGTAAYLAEQGITVQVMNKVLEGRPHIVDAIKNGEIAAVINTVSSDVQSVSDGTASAAPPSPSACRNTPPSPVVKR